MVQNRVDDGPFQATISGVTIGNLMLTKFSLSNLKAITTPQTLRHENNKTDHLFMSMVLKGAVSADQYDRSSTDKADDFSIRDTNTPWTIEHAGYSEVLAIQIPRERLESMLGATRRFAGLTVEGTLPTAILARSYLCNLARLAGQLTPQVADRLVGVGLDLVIASVAERMALETPKALQGTLIVQRAKAHVAAHLGDADLDPAQLAAAVAVSLRHLQALFRAEGLNVAAWIWQRRLEAAAQRLSDPACLALQIGEIAYRCGFADQAHFSRRFRDRYGASPRAYRHAALTQAAAS
ncbi:AraC-type DNA-binding protein [Methylobacterium phyllostachyos]|uniref:AraC-type DNA-binding protein n=2 Tax=Methylobacterium phyllostachyos TaxID=582672 RepID=A0A1H0EDA5_9HYPH|nr:AraC-type DNA-binding protein [Methylobacterium phyllostachyos]